jgi:signal transduction histidine kinase
MGFFSRFKPAFWDSVPQDGELITGLFDYRKTWRQAVLLLAVVALVPLMVMTFIDYSVTKRSLKSESLLRLARVTSNTRRALNHYLEERKNALEYIVQHESVDTLRQPEQLQSVLTSLKKSFGGFVDLGLIRENGRQVAYIGPYNLQGRDYQEQEWFLRTLDRGAFISGVFPGFRDVPHIIVAVLCPGGADGGSYVLRATLDTEQFNNLLSAIDLDDGGDVFLIDRDGVLQTPSRSHGDVLDSVGLPVPGFSNSTRVFEANEKDGSDALVGYAYIRGTPFVLIVVKVTSKVMRPWQTIRAELFWLLAVSISVILLAIIWVAARMVAKIHMADQTRIKTLENMEHTNRMASLGRLAAGVAHEINNPLAIINEKAGLIHDLFTYKKEYKGDPKLLAAIESILSSVRRCGAITKRLLGFARQLDVAVEEIDFRDLVEEVVGFLGKEAEYRSIRITMDVSEDLPWIHTDPGRLQQVVLNLVTNAFQAMNDWGHLDISARIKDDYLSFTVRDDGCGIPEEDLKRIFEPFFSTKKGSGGTGLGLFITYGLVQELGGRLEVESEPGVGTAFTIILPLRPQPKGTEKA